MSRQPKQIGKIHENNFRIEFKTVKNFELQNLQSFLHIDV